VWKDWYSKLQTILTSSASLTWALIDKSGSRLSDIVTRPHSDLTGVLGTGPYHMTSAEATAVTDHAALKSKAGDPTTTDIPASAWAIYKNTSSGTVKLWVNDGGTLKSVTLT
jgi:hypothetical protein